MMELQVNKGRMGSSAGIAIGPILFIIAILAILAAAIAAGSGSFTAGTSGESNKTKSVALIQMGENLKIGMDRIIMEGGLDIASIDVNVNNTSQTNALFSPTGGGIAPPSVGMSNNPLYDKWYFPKGKVKGLGSGAGNWLAVTPVSSGVCAEINNRSVGVSTAPAAAALGDFTAGTPVVDGDTAWPTTPNLVGVSTGCVYNNNVTLGTGCTINAGGSISGCTAGPTSQYFFYQVLAIQ